MIPNGVRNSKTCLEYMGLTSEGEVGAVKHV